jgi:hypothetical protein
LRFSFSSSWCFSCSTLANDCSTCLSLLSGFSPVSASATSSPAASAFAFASSAASFSSALILQMGTAEHDLGALGIAFQPQA